MSGTARTGTSDNGSSDAGEQRVRAALAERVRKALVACALAAYEDAGVRGLCADGAWEAAVAAMRQLDLSRLPPDSAPAAEPAGGIPGAAF